MFKCRNRERCPLGSHCLGQINTPRLMLGSYLWLQLSLVIHCSQMGSTSSWNSVHIGIQEFLQPVADLVFLAPLVITFYQKLCENEKKRIDFYQNLVSMAPGRSANRWHLTREVFNSASALSSSFYHCDLRMIERKRNQKLLSASVINDRQTRLKTFHFYTLMREVKILKGEQHVC